MEQTRAHYAYIEVHIQVHIMHTLKYIYTCVYYAYIEVNILAYNMHTLGYIYKCITVNPYGLYKSKNVNRWKCEKNGDE